MQKEIVKLVGPNNGPTSVVMVGVHGNEPCGLLALEELLLQLQINSGTVFFIVGNPNAVTENVRFTEFNLNRAFKEDDLLTNLERNSYEYHRAQFLKQYLNQTSALLDIHSSFTLDSTPFVICEENAFDIVKHFPVDLVVYGFDKINPGGTDYYMNSTGKIGICIECGEHLSEDAVKIAKQAILSFLTSRSHIYEQNLVTPTKQRKITVVSIYHSKTNNFKLSKGWGDFEKVSDGVLIGIDGQKQIFAEKDSIILFARNCDKIGGEAFYLAEENVKLGPYGEWPKDGH